jgi:hypothetical protein
MVPAMWLIAMASAACSTAATLQANSIVLILPTLHDTLRRSLVFFLYRHLDGIP